MAPPPPTDSGDETSGMDPEDDDYDDEAINGDDDNDNASDQGACCPTVRFTEEKLRELRAPWMGSFIIKLRMEQIVEYRSLEKDLLVMWRPKGQMTFLSLGCDFFVVRFECPEDRTKVLQKGPWILRGHCLAMRDWIPDFNPEATSN